MQVSPSSTSNSKTFNSKRNRTYKFISNDTPNIPNEEQKNKMFVQREVKKGMFGLKEVYYMSCNYCRSRKTKCDRLRPSCTRCLSTGIKCVYKPVKIVKPSLVSEPVYTKNLLPRKDVDAEKKVFKKGLLDVPEEKDKDNTNFILSQRTMIHNAILCNTSNNQLLLETAVPPDHLATLDSADLKISSNLKYMLSMYLTWHYPYLPLIYKPKFLLDLRRSAALFYSVLCISCHHCTDDKLPYNKLTTFFFEKAAKELEYKSKKYTNCEVQAYMHMSFFCHMGGDGWGGVKFIGDAARLANLLGTSKVNYFPTLYLDNVKPHLINIEEECRTFWVLYLSDVAIGLMTGNSFNINLESIEFLSPVERKSSQCQLHSSQPDYLSETCHHSNLEWEAMDLKKHNQFLLETFLFGCLAQIRTLYRKLSIETSWNRTRVIVPDLTKLYATVAGWRHFINRHFPVKQIWSDLPYPNSHRITEVYLRMALHTLSNDAIILLAYPNLSLEIPNLPTYADPTATYAAIFTLHIFLYLNPLVDLFAGPFWYFNVTTSVRALSYALIKPGVPEEVQLQCRNGLAQALQVFTHLDQTPKRLRWPKLHDHYFPIIRKLIYQALDQKVVHMAVSFSTVATDKVKAFISPPLQLSFTTSYRLPH